MSNLLIDEYPLVVLPTLAKVLDSVNAAIVLNQIHYWIKNKRAPEREGRRWHYETFEKWLEQFPWLSLRTLKRVIEYLEKKNLVISKEFNKLKGDRTKWYSINYEALKELELSLNTHSAKLAQPSCKDDTTIVPNWHDAYKEEETTKETTKDIDTPLKPPKGAVDGKKIDEVFERVWEQYQNKVGKVPAKKKFIKQTQNMSWEEFEQRVKIMWEGLQIKKTHYDLLDKIRELHPDWNVFYPDWQHGSTWFNKEAWLDKHETDWSTLYEKTRGKQGQAQNRTKSYVRTQ